ncbi:hypothetical protein JOL79_23815 [Microbispora sp. RL4-1S]|uniref:Lipoprotein n=1 Tax=Microbispora oryzae TaxID=2806554 RepID=A0A940WKW0_9ACTN|nr:hypothetical protein [Microbispora oryzae]MBP2706838.1 hypothetical protein [Microbispora oryzae]
MRGIITISLLAGLSLSACNQSETPKLPTAAQVEPTLKSHINRTLRNAFATDVRVTDPGGRDIPCGNSSAKRTYAVKAKAGIGSGNPEMVVLALISGLHQVAKYQLPSYAVSLTEQAAVSAQYRTRLVLSSPKKGEMVVRGETECLPLK